ncbi:MAG: T9SS type A sorting domain-containing protein [Bacteroidales bacterium]|nr:T9SS type A sorting domain-containing protein [Bacteroidales bacterium]
MKNLFIAIIFLQSFSLFCQTSFGPQQIIANDADGVTDLAFADLNSDGHLDIIASLYYSNKVVWYENDGTGLFGQQQLITDNAQGALLVDVNDFSGDEIPDVVSVSYIDNKITWYENDGNGNFSTQVLSGNIENAIDLIAIDLDNDLDCDILVGTETKIFWYKNNGNGNFGSQILIANIAGGDQPHYHITVGDLDNDNDNDIISGCLMNIYWYQNNGFGNYGPKVLLNNYGNIGITSLQSNDIDKDGDMDILAGIGDWSYYKIEWYENNGSGFSPNSIVSGVLEGVFALSLELDGDNLTDILAAPYGFSKNTGYLFWLRNNGNENFSDEIIIATELNISGLFSNDLDNDGDQDIIGASSENNHIFYFNNLLNSTTHIEYFLCENDSILIGDEWITESGSYPFDTLTGVFGGDSILIYDISLHQNPDEFQITGPVDVEEYENATYSVPDNSEVEYTWEVENGNIIQQISETAIEVQWGLSAIGKVTATAENVFGCSTVEFVEVIIGDASVKELNELGIQIYPNPASDFLYVYVPDKTYQLDLTDLNGRTIIEIGSPQTNISKVSPGVYLVKVKDESGNILGLGKLIIK